MGDTKETRRVFYSGRVQGVWFRKTTWQLAQPLPVSGFVRNLGDGRVELVAHGTPEAIDQLLDAVSQRFEQNITSVDVEAAESTTVDESFEIR